MKDKKNTQGFATKAIHSGQEPDPTTGAIIGPIYTSSTYVQDSPGEHKGYDYSRTANPTRRALEICIADLEEGGQGFAFSSGMAATATVLEILDSGDHVISMDDLYGGTYRLFENVRKRSSGLDFSYSNLTSLDNLESFLKPNSKMIWVESPSNPLLKVVDLKKVSEFGKKHNLITVCDNTFCSSYVQKPLSLGFDIVLHSATKYLNGHSDVISGALAARENSEFWQRLVAIRAQSGAVPSPQDASQLLRGMRTLFLRVRESCQNALYIAEQLEQHLNVTEVLYPGLKSFAGHDVATKQMQGGFGGMLSIRLAGGEKAAIAVAAQTQLWHRATSLGGVESLIEHRSSIEGPDTPVPSDLLRLSVGIESADDLLKDLQQAIDSAHA